MRWRHALHGKGENDEHIFMSCVQISTKRVNISFSSTYYCVRLQIKYPHDFYQWLKAWFSKLSTLTTLISGSKLGSIFTILTCYQMTMTNSGWCRMTRKANWIQIDKLAERGRSLIESHSVCICRYRLWLMSHNCECKIYDTWDPEGH